MPEKCAQNYFDKFLTNGTAHIWQQFTEHQYQLTEVVIYFLLLLIYYSTLVRVQNIAMIMSVRRSACPLAYLKNHTFKLHQLFCA